MVNAYNEPPTAARADTPPAAVMVDRLPSAVPAVSEISPMVARVSRSRLLIATETPAPIDSLLDTPPAQDMWVPIAPE